MAGTGADSRRRVIGLGDGALGCIPDTGVHDVTLPADRTTWLVYLFSVATTCALDATAPCSRETKPGGTVTDGLSPAWAALLVMRTLDHQ